MTFLRWSLSSLLLVMVLSACASQSIPAPSPQPTDVPDDSIAPLGSWSLQYVGKCAGRDAENIDITVLDETQIVFEEFTLTISDDGVYVGSIQSIAPMPADGRDIVFETVIELAQEDRNTFSGTETITETGKGADDCPIQLVYQGDE